MNELQKSCVNAMLGTLNSAACLFGWSQFQKIHLRRCPTFPLTESYSRLACAANQTLIGNHLKLQSSGVALALNHSGAACGNWSNVRGALVCRQHSRRVHFDA